MSRPSNNVAAFAIQPVLQTSVLAMPFVRLALTPHHWLQLRFQESHLGQQLGALWRALVTPLRTKAEAWHRAHENLLGLHWLTTLATLLLTTFASTELIGLSVVISFALMCLRALLRPLRLQVNIIDLFIALFFTTALVSTAFSSYIHTSIIGMAKFSVFAMGYWNFRVLLSERPKSLTWVLCLLLVLGVAESVIGLYQYVNHVQPLATWQDTSINSEDQLTRIFGTLKPSNPNLLAGFLIPCLGAGIGLTLSQVFAKRWLSSFILVSGTGIILIALILTGSRGGYLALMIMSLMTFLYLGDLFWNDATLKHQPRLKALWILILVGAVLATLGAALFLPAIRNRFLSIFAMREDSSNSYRLNVWASTWRMIQHNWLVGIGPGNDTFKQVYGLYMTPGYNALSAYSIFLEIWAEQGILGLLAFLVTLIITGLRTCMAFYIGLPLQQKLMIGALFTGAIGSVFYGLFDTIWYRPSVNLLFWLFMAGLAMLTESALTHATTQHQCHETH